ALRKLNLTRAQVQVEILQEARRGILGFGGGEAKVRVTPLTSPEPITPPREVQPVEKAQPTPSSGEAESAAKEVTETLLALMKVPATVEVRQSAEDGAPPMLEIVLDDPGMLIGRRGQTLSSMQYMVNFIASRKQKSDTRVVIDVAGYRMRRQEELKNMAIRIADLVKTNRRSITLEPMLAWERRIVHLTLREDPEVNTGSIGYGERRKVVISPRKRA
ncbi:MAG: KH domain-containing protein, partial [Chloroflexi bacterium]|nr:KH domain-containing protein [Chloroflexota bacterium]